MASKIETSLEKALDLTVSPNNALRVEGWHRLRARAAAFRHEIDSAKRTFLGNLLAHEGDCAVFQAGILAMLEFLRRQQAFLPSIHPVPGQSCTR